MVGFDVSILAALLLGLPRRDDEPTRRRRAGRIALAALGLAGTIVAVVVSRGGPAAQAATPGRSFLVDPAAWSGQRLPLLDQVDVRDRIAEGRWVVVLHRSECDACREALPRCRGLARSWASAGRPEFPRFAFIEMPPHTAVAEPDRGEPWLDGRLAEDVDWFARTPAVLFIEDGLVRPMTDLDALPGAEVIPR